MTTKKAAKKTPAKKTPTKKTPAKKAKKAAKKTPAKKAAKKTPAKKAAKKTAAKKASGGVVVSGTRHDPPVFLLVHLPEGLEPYARAERFEDPLEQALGVHGAVTGGGTSFADDGTLESCDIEIEVSDIIRALPIIRRVLTEQGAPEGSVITRLTRSGEFEILYAIGEGR
jgi:hypothetical protein